MRLITLSMNKKYYLTGVAIVVFLCLTFYKYIAPSGICDNANLFLCSYNMDDVVRVCNMAGLFLFFSLVTIFLKTSWITWWRFAWWGGSVAILLILLINAGLHHSPGGWMNMDHDVDQLLTFFVYVFFTVGSLIQLYRGWRQSAFHT